MKKDLTQIVFILDKSGSMYGLESDTIGGFNSMIKKQQEVEGDALVTTVLFNDKNNKIHDQVPIKDVKPLTTSDYITDGMTALLDAIGDTIKSLEKQYSKGEENSSQKTIVIITTDGQENASREYSLQQIKNLVKEKQEEGWEFLFLGANIDAIQTARSFGIRPRRAVTFRNDSKGIQSNYRAINSAIHDFRIDTPLEDNWKAEIEDYFQSSEQEDE